jgi:hypothetical protein
VKLISLRTPASALYFLFVRHVRSLKGRIAIYRSAVARAAACWQRCDPPQQDPTHERRQLHAGLPTQEQNHTAAMAGMENIEVHSKVHMHALRHPEHG